MITEVGGCRRGAAGVALAGSGGPFNTRPALALQADVSIRPVENRTINNMISGGAPDRADAAR